MKANELSAADRAEEKRTETEFPTLDELVAQDAALTQEERDEHFRQWVEQSGWSVVNGRWTLDGGSA